MEAEQKEQEFLAAQAIQETKQAAARRAAAKANLARLKRRNELQRTQAEAQLKLLRIHHQNEVESMMDVEKSTTQLSSVSSVPIMSTSQIEAKKQLDAFEANRKATEDKMKADALKIKQESERKQKELAAKKETELKKKKEMEEKLKEKKAAEQLKKREEQEKKKQILVEENSSKINQEMENFSVTLNKKHFDSALKMQTELKEQGMDIPLKIHSSDVYKKSFTFPQIAHNDYAVEQLESLSIAEQNLNKDPSNDTLFDNFVATANDVANNLS